MGRIVSSERFYEQHQLILNIIAKHKNDGTGSPLNILIKAEKLDLKFCEKAADEAHRLYGIYVENNQLSESNRQLRDIELFKLKAFNRPCISYLKSMYKPNLKGLFEWGIIANLIGKVINPKNSDGQVTLFNKIKEKQDSYSPNESYLNQFLVLNNYNLDELAIIAANVAEYQRLHTFHGNIASTAIQQKQLLWDDMPHTISNITSFLKCLYKSNDKALGKWSIIVAGTKKKPAVRTTKLGIAEKITTKGVVLSSIFENIGLVSIALHKGPKVLPDPVIVKPFENFTLTKGFSVLNAVNMSSDNKGRYRVTVMK